MHGGRKGKEKKCWVRPTSDPTRPLRHCEVVKGKRYQNLWASHFNGAPRPYGRAPASFLRQDSGLRPEPTSQMYGSVPGPYPAETQGPYWGGQPSPYLERAPGFRPQVPIVPLGRPQNSPREDPRFSIRGTKNARNGYHDNFEAQPNIGEEQYRPQRVASSYPFQERARNTETNRVLNSRRSRVEDYPENYASNFDRFRNHRPREQNDPFLRDDRSHFPITSPMDRITPATNNYHPSRTFSQSDETLINPTSFSRSRRYEDLNFNSDNSTPLQCATREHRRLLTQKRHTQEGFYDPHEERQEHDRYNDLGSPQMDHVSHNQGDRYGDYMRPLVRTVDFSDSILPIPRDRYQRDAHIGDRDQRRTDTRGQHSRYDIPFGR